MVRRMATIAMVVAMAGCSLDASGVGMGSPLGPSQSTAESGGTLDGDGSGGDTEAGQGSGGATSGLDDTAGDGPPMDSGPGGHPVVIISDGPTFDFGSPPIGTSLEHTFVITNEGDGDATALQLGLTGTFTLQGHDCGETLAAGDACEVQVRFAPVVFGSFVGELSLGFQDVGTPASASRAVAGRGVGMTGNLVVNGSGEEGGSPPSAWSAADGNWGTTTVGPMPVDGARMINGSLDWIWEPDTFRLIQQLDATVVTLWDDAAGVRFHFRASHRPSMANDDPTSVIFRFHASDGSVIMAYPSDVNAAEEWLETTGDWVAPANTHFVQVELVCERSAGETACNGYFDDVQVWAQWDG